MRGNPGYAYFKINTSYHPVSKAFMFHVLDHSDVVYTDATLIRLYGVNMLDAAINRFEALIAYDEFHCPRKAAEIYGQRHGLNLQAA